MLHIRLRSEGEAHWSGCQDDEQQGDAQQGADDGLRFTEHVQHGHQETATSQGDANSEDSNKQIGIDTLTEATEHGNKDHQGTMEEVCVEQIRSHSANKVRNHPSNICKEKASQSGILKRFLCNLLRECRPVATLKTRPTV